MAAFTTIDDPEAYFQVKLGSSDMTPTQVREVLKTGKMKTVQDENAPKKGEQ